MARNKAEGIGRKEGMERKGKSEGIDIGEICMGRGARMYMGENGII